jgi:MFS superfamily sulfate permease-like transporter
MVQRSALVERWIPGIRAARTYDRAWLRSDLVAGVVLAAILVPQGMAYAELAGLPAVTGLYTTIACLVGYAIFGPSRVLVLGPDSSVSPLILAAITPLFVAGDTSEAIALAGMLAVFVGVIAIGLGLGRLGFVADLLSSEVRVGYMNGLAITIIVGQLPKLFGYSTDADDFIDELDAFVSWRSSERLLCRRFSTSPMTVLTPSGRYRVACPRPRCPGPSSATSARCCSPRSASRLSR